ncbi:uncharacterized protein M6B38_418365 [Iris pallida]|uniref:Uncharacterized protein n=1 Tax=Iris pallida TaxID=29817 RepID=A0AAX6DS12_IRIPA|nr:Uncharacterized protein M6B38_229775 [Iris pallida]KAJ6815839.1 uncharacterized protein M6B38_418365 [Iris pallida]
MLFAVEGGGFFSSSATGYSKGLALLLLGQKPEERPTRVTPWNHYRLVDRGTNTDTPPASRKKRSSCQCTSFICFGCKSAEPGSSSSPKTGTTHKPETSQDSSNSSDKDRVSDSLDESDRKLFLKSSLKRSSTNCSAIVGIGDGSDDSFEEVQSNISCIDRRKIHWPDACGGELAEIREFEASERGASDDEFENEGARRCQCVIQ